MTPEADPTPTETPAEFVAELNRLRTWAGRPSLRRLEKLSGGQLGDGFTEPLPSSTTSEILAGKRLPKLPRLAFVEAFVAACLRARELDDQTVEHTVDRWRAAWRAVRVDRATPPPPDPDAVPPPVARFGRRLNPRRTLVASAVLVAVFAAGVLVGVTGSRITRDSAGDPPSSPPASTAPKPASQTCQPPNQPHAPGTIAMGPPGTPPVDGTNPDDWWTNVTTVGLTTGHDGFTAIVPSGFVLPSELIVIRSGITLTAGHHYRLDFTATANRPVTIQVRIQDKTPPLYRPSLVESVPIGTTPCRRTYTFTASATSPTTGEVTFQLGAQGAHTITVNDPILVDTET